MQFREVKKVSTNNYKQLVEELHQQLNNTKEKD